MAVRVATKNADAIFKNLYPWQNLESFNKHILDSIIYNLHGIIAINKPYGVKINQEEPRESTKPIKSTFISSSASNSRYCLSQAIPFLQSELNENNLRIVKSTEMYSSGITILATNDKHERKFRKAIATVKGNKTSPFSFLTVTVGRMQQRVLNERVAIMLRESKTNGVTSKTHVILNQFTTSQSKKDNIKPAFVNVETLAVDDETNTSLLKISSTMTKWRFFRVYCAHKGVPILGDNMFGPRVRWMFGKPFLISTDNQAAYNAPTVPSSVLHKLSLSESNIVLIPVHLHLHELNFKLYDKDLAIRAEPAEFFQLTCQSLGLNAENKSLELEKKV